MMVPIVGFEVAQTKMGKITMKIGGRVASLGMFLLDWVETT